MKLNENELRILNEAFKAGSSLTVITKLLSILSKRVGSEITLAEVPIDYSNDYGNFTGYYGLIGSGNSAIRVNFGLGKSDRIVSCDYYPSIGVSPETTLEFDVNDNIIAIVNALEDLLVNNITENPLNEKVSIGKDLLAERTPISEEAVTTWILSDERTNTDLIQNTRLSNLYKYDYVEWANNNDRPKLSLSSFMKAIKTYLDENRMTNKFLYGARFKKGSTETLISSEKEEKDFLKSMELSANAKFEQLESFIDLLIQGGMTNSVVVSGRAGTGKSRTTIDTLEKRGVSYKLASGGFKSVKDFYQALFRSRNGESIMVLDDFSVDTKISNLLKGALDQNSGIVTWLDKDHISNRDWQELSPAKQAKKYPSTFRFEGKIIILTNVPISKLNSAVIDRSMVVDLNMSNAEILGRIKGAINEFPPTVVDINIKMEAMNFLVNILDQIKDLSFRMFEKVCAFASTGHPNWQAWALNAISVQGKGGA